MKNKIKLCAVCSTEIPKIKKYCSQKCSDQAKKDRYKKENSVCLGTTKRSTSLKTLKKKAWVEFSRFVRLSHADSEGMVRCVTCGNVGHWTTMQAGHFVDSRCNSVLFHEEIVHPQCYGCNVMLHGNKVAYTLYMLDKGYTVEDIERFEVLKKQTKKISIGEMKYIYELYWDLSNELEAKLTTS